MMPLMVQGTSSGAGKTVLVAALCRIFSDMGCKVAPFKSQNMSCASYMHGGTEIAQAQAVQAVAARCEVAHDLNPILLKPLGDDSSMVYLDGVPYKKMHAMEYYREFVNSVGIRAASRSLKSLQKRYDLVIMEGAGSPAEINLQRYDIANMRMAHLAGAAVLLVADMDRGGSFAGIAGTMSLLQERHRNLVRGYIFNKFRGDIGILRPGFARLRRITGRPVLGTVPYVQVGLPEEDSLGGRPLQADWSDSGVRRMNEAIDRMAGIVRENLDVGRIRRMIR